jgi:hypothetical protein
MASPDEFDRAEVRAKVRRAKYPAAVEAYYDSRAGKIVVSLDSGVEISFAPAIAQGLNKATDRDLKTIEITPSGLGLHFPKIDADLYIPSLLEGVFGTRKWMAKQLGAAGGSAKSTAKSEASRRNGKLGGRPRKVA